MSVFVLISCISLILRLVAATCYVDNSSGLLMPIVRDASGAVMCPRGFHCPGFNASDPATYPVYCPPSPDCQTQRLQGMLCDNSMGTYEPWICPKGKYCPDASQILECPSEYYCPLGQAAPLPCPAGSTCSAGSESPMTILGIVFLVILGACIPVALTVYRRVIIPSSDELHGPADLGRCFAESNGSTKPLRIDFDDLSITLRDQKKSLLSAVSGSLRPGTVTAILGPSGSGKTVLLHALLGRYDANWLATGTVSINGDCNITKYRSMIGSVPQDDVLHTELTVYRNVSYAAELRLPPEWTKAERQAVVSMTLRALGLSHVADVPIGDAESRGVSGGQRKRASIAVELVAAPRAMFLDEPTKGLDSNTALELMNTLRSVAEETDLTVAMSVNQPRAEIWNALDEILIIAPGGRTAFQGRRRDVEAYLHTTFGIEFPRQANPADVVLDAVSLRGEEMANAWSRRAPPPPPESTIDAVRSNSSFGHEIEPVPWRGASLLTQVKISHLRYLEKQLCGLTSLYVEIGVALILGIILGYSMAQNTLLGRYLPPFQLISPFPLYDAPAQLHMYAMMSVGLATSTAGVNTFMNDKETFLRAVSCGSSRIAHYIGTVTASWYRLFIVALAFACPYHILGKMTSPFAGFYMMFVVFAWVMYAVAGIVALVVDRVNAPLVAGVASIVYGCFSGFIDFPVGLKRISFTFWACQALQQWEFDDTLNVFEEQLTRWGWELDQVGESFGITISMGVIYHIIACILILSVHK
mmetsp:Transcript_60670/g.70354  ORF Transcript_60670/g.70354 Transcript_60670/m.70354 type:complete len:757 (-) Transcript_60670:522-2792(-)